MQSSLKLTSKLSLDTHQVDLLKAAFLNLSAPKLSEPINKNAIISEFDASCQKKGTKCKAPSINPTNYPTIYQLVRGCSTKTSLNHQYQVGDLSLDYVIVVLLKSLKSYHTNKEVANLSKVNLLYQEMVQDIVMFRTLDFSKLQEPRTGYAEQTAIKSSHVRIATACAICYSLHCRMVFRYLKGCR
jgi:hypothetical protein